jgi:hypothetical protein
VVGVRESGGEAVSGEIAFGCAISEDRQHSAIVAAGRGTSGRVVVDLVWYEHPAGAVARMAELTEKHDPLAVVVDGLSQSATLLRPLADAGVAVRSPTAQESAVAHGDFLDLVNGGGLEHLDQPPVTAAVRAALERPRAGAQVWDRRVPTDQSPLIAATLAVWAFMCWEVLSQPSTWVI